MMLQPRQTAKPTSPRTNESRSAHDPITAAIVQLADRISGVLTEERQLLAAAGKCDFDAVVARKSHLALELNRLIQHASGSLDTEPLRSCLRSLSHELDENAALLRRHIEAVREVSSILASAINSASTDGTYSADIARHGAASW